MLKNKDTTIPATGFRGLRENWKSDLTSAFSVALVGLPLGLGISLASNAPAMAGIISVVIGGLVATFFRGSHVAINGAAKGLIVVVLSGVTALSDNGDAITGFKYVLGAIIIAGALQMLLGILKMGKFGDLFSSSVIQGMLAAIGVIIFGKQIHVALGADTSTTTALDALIKIPESIANLNPIVTFIALISILILIFQPKMKNKVISAIPAPLWVLIFAIPISVFFNFSTPQTLDFLGRSIQVGPEFLIQVPSNIADSFMFPDFSKIGNLDFWVVVISVTLIGSIESLVSAKAVDKLDYYKRSSNLNKDLFAIGLSTMVSGMIGGLPVVTVIIRSSINVNQGAKTRWSNFFQGALLAIFIVAVPSVIQQIPVGALAAILVFTGYRLASPKVFKDTALKGWEQVLILLAAFVITLATNLLGGIFGGIVVALVVQYIRAPLNFKQFVQSIRTPYIKSIPERNDTILFKVKGVLNFLSMIKLRNKLDSLPPKLHVVVDFSHTKLIDSTVLDYIYDHKNKYNANEGDLEIIGLDVHNTSTNHPSALHILEKPQIASLSRRQQRFYHFAKPHEYTFNPNINWDNTILTHFDYFKFKQLEYRNNIIRGSFKDINVAWEISDITYDEGISIAAEEHHVTAMILQLPVDLIDFIITKDEILAFKDGKKVKDSGITHILDYISQNNLPVSLKKDLEEFFDNNYHYYIENTKEELLIFKKDRLISSVEMIVMHDFARQLCVYLLKVFATNKFKN